MANYASLKAAIQEVVKTNGNNEITGALLQQSLLAMINSLGGYYQFAGIATPSTNPGTPDQNVFYLASTAGTYSNFGSIVIAENEAAILKYNGTWSKDSSGFATSEKVSQLGAKMANISTESTEDNEEKIQVVSDDGQTVYFEISHNGVNAKNLKSNGEQVLTPTTGATKTELNAKQDIIPEIQSEEILEELSEQEWCSDDYDGNGNGEIYAKVNSNGMFAKNIKRLDGASVLFAPLFGKKIRIFGGSVAFLLDKYTGGDIIRSTGATLTDDAQSGAGFANNISLVDGNIVYDGVNIQKQIDDATAPGQTKFDIYIIWASTNDYTTASIQVGDNEDYTIADNFDVSKRLTQCGGINYCIKKLCEFAPEAKVVVFGSLKCFGNPGGGWTEGGCGLAGRLKALVDGQHECAMRSSLPFFSLWENSGFNEYNNNTYFYHGNDDMYYPEGHGNDGTHPNKEGYIYLANKIINFLNTI